MPVRDIIIIDEEKCDGCGHCVDACAEGALDIIHGKARLVSDFLCDGFGECLGSCPQDALTIEKREARKFDESKVKENIEMKQNKDHKQDLPCGCPGSNIQMLSQTVKAQDSPQERTSNRSQLGHWPVQLKLVPPSAPFLRDADLLICADCVPFAVPDFHRRYLKDHAVVVGCPKLDDLQYYYEKLKDIYKQARPQRITVLKMEVPCCNGLAEASLKARDEVAPDIEAEVHTIKIKGGIEIEMIAAKAEAI